MIVRQHRPAYVEGFENAEAEIQTSAELLALEFIDRWISLPEFYRFSVSDYAPGTKLLMAELKGGSEWWVVAYLYGENLDVNLPKWHKPDDRPTKSEPQSDLRQS